MKRVWREAGGGDNLGGMAKNPVYHLRRMDRDMSDRREQLAVIRGQKVLTLAMCREGEPYLVALDYAFSEEENCFYVHCATEGKKNDWLRDNPRVCGQVVEDGGYVAGKCVHAYRSVIFEGAAEHVEGAEQKRRALEMLVEQLEPDPVAAREKLMEKARLENVVVLRVRVMRMSGKKSPGSSVWS